MAQEIEMLYAWTRETRANLLHFLGEMPPETLTSEHPHVPWGSFRNLLIHVASAYNYWLKRVGLGEKIERLEPAAYPDMAAIRGLFAATDALVADFLARHRGAALHEPVTRELKRPEGIVRFTLTPYWLVSNCIVHEFNHKGQILTSARARGHTFRGRSDLAFPAGGYELLEAAE